MRLTYRLPSPLRKATRAAVVTIALLAAAPAPARAADCGAESTQSAMNACAERDFRAADAALNAAYDRVVERLVKEDSATALLTTAQRAWVGFRDADCAFAATGVQGGSVYPLIALTCRARLTRQRTQTLERYLACREGELDCPVPPR